MISGIGKLTSSLTRAVITMITIIIPGGKKTITVLIQRIIISTAMLPPFSKPLKTLILLTGCLLPLLILTRKRHLISMLTMHGRKITPGSIILTSTMMLFLPAGVALLPRTHLLTEAMETLYHSGTGSILIC